MPNDIDSYVLFFVFVSFFTNSMNFFDSFMFPNICISYNCLNVHQREQHKMIAIVLNVDNRDEYDSNKSHNEGFII